MLSYNDLKPGVIIVYEGSPHEILKADFLRKQQRKPVMQTDIRNLLTGKVIQRNFHMNESFEEADIEKTDATYLYTNRGEIWFCEGSDRAKRFTLSSDIAGPQAPFINQNTPVRALRWNGDVISIEWPIKSEVVIKETVPGERGNTSSGGTKAATLETGAVIQVPLFINNGDVIRINTDTGAYTERVEKAGKTL